MKMQGNCALPPFLPHTTRLPFAFASFSAPGGGVPISAIALASAELLPGSAPPTTMARPSSAATCRTAMDRRAWLQY